MYNAAKLDQLIQQMTLEEKAGMCSGKDSWYLKDVSRLGIPSVMMSDGPHGLRKQAGGGEHLGMQESIPAVCFPAACATAASFDRELLHRLGDTLGKICQQESVSVLLGPGINIKRSPLCGRNFEYFSEDPYLTGELAGAQVRGIQSHHVGSSLKHYAANNQEYQRMSCSSELDERTLREIYLAAFETIIKKEQPFTVMASYNRLNGEYVSESRKMLTQILREEWGFEGYVVSDWGAVNDRVKALAAGLDLEMPSSGGQLDAEIVMAVQNGVLSEDILDKTVKRILQKVYEFTENRENVACSLEDAHQIAVEMEKECAVLLKNDGILPLQRNQNIIYIGEFAKHPRYQGGGSSHINAAPPKGAWYFSDKAPCFCPQSAEDLSVMLKAAAEADAAVIFTGLPDELESECYDRKDMHLPEKENSLIQKVCAIQKNTVIVLHHGAPVEMPWVNETGAILDMYLGGEGVGEAADSLLYGDSNPCGHLPETFPLRLEDTPSYFFFPGDGKRAEYKEGIYVGYRYYDSKKMPVLFPFGHGLSYTDFTFDNLKTDREELTETGILTVTADVTNTGNRAGKAVAQLYIKDLTQTAQRPVHELKGFEKVFLKPGETKQISMTVSAKSLSWYNPYLKDWYAANGEYEIQIGQSSRSICCKKTIAFHGEPKLKYRITPTSTVGELMKIDILRPTAEQVIHSIKTQILHPMSGESEREAEHRLLEMILGAPIRSIRSFGGTTDIMNDLIRQFNKILLDNGCLAEEE